MRKIFLYECKRLLWNKFFAGLVLVLLFYGWQVLRRVTILGVSHTAPFSPWSFGDFLSRMLPLLWIGALFFLTFFTSEKAGENFNPRSHEGSDIYQRLRKGNRKNFNPRSHEGSDCIKLI